MDVRTQVCKSGLARPEGVKISEGSKQSVSQNRNQMREGERESRKRGGETNDGVGGISELGGERVKNSERKDTHPDHHHHHHRSSLLGTSSGTGRRGVKQRINSKKCRIIIICYPNINL